MEQRQGRAGGVTAGAADSGSIRLDAGTGRLVVSLLEMLAELPSTVEIVADGARMQASRVVERLPRSRRRTSREHQQTMSGSVSLDVETATEVVELLELFSELPSTPPVVAQDAQQQAAEIARHLPGERRP